MTCSPLPVQPVRTTESLRVFAAQETYHRKQNQPVDTIDAPAHRPVSLRGSPPMWCHPD
ncbi:hypothetical protein MTE2_4818 [Klebsiella pneumoniae VA360]|nr:hypothetical protein MTE2_4818 [Klebsiella pneumoniae VA360]